MLAICGIPGMLLHLWCAFFLLNSSFACLPGFCGTQPRPSISTPNHLWVDPWHTFGLFFIVRLSAVALVATITLTDVIHSDLGIVRACLRLGTCYVLVLTEL